jgi:hypothetical protein
MTFNFYLIIYKARSIIYRALKYYLKTFYIYVLLYKFFDLLEKWELRMYIYRQIIFLLI